VKKFLLIPATLLTALLAVAFVSPAAASSVVRAVVPALHLVGVPTSALASGDQASTAGSSGTSLTSNGNSATVGSSSQSAGSNAALLQVPAVGDSVATPGQENCGRFGNGFHGGKHLFVCPNRPFPPPPNH